jgi:hypothetical protein
MFKEKRIKTYSKMIKETLQWEMRRSKEKCLRLLKQLFHLLVSVSYMIIWKIKRYGMRMREKTLDQGYRTKI